MLNPISPKVQRYNKYVTVSGRTQGQVDGAWHDLPDADAVRSASLQRRNAGTSTWRTIQTDATPSTFSFTVRAVRNAHFRVVYNGGSYGTWTFPAAISTTQALHVRRNLNDRLVRRAGFHMRGNVNPGGRVVVHVQRKKCASCAYRGYKRVRANRAGKFSVRLAAPRRGSHYFRAYVKGNRSYTKSFSNNYYRLTRY